MMSSCSGDFQSATCLQLSTHIGKVEIKKRFVDRCFRHCQWQRVHAVDMRDNIEQAARDIGLDITCQGNFIAITEWHDQGPSCLGAGKCSG